MGGSKSGGTTSTSSGPPEQFLNAYSNVVNQAKNVAGQPLQQYSGQMVAGFNPYQTTAMSGIANNVGVANPYINAASQEYGQATTPLWDNTQQFSPSAVSQYESPYTQQVVNATQNEFNNQNAQQNQDIIGNAITHGAWGGDRAGVAQGIAAGQEALAQAPVIAGLENTGYSQALGEFNTQQQAQLGANESNAWLGNQVAAGLAGLGTEAQNTGLTGLNALYGAGTAQQQLEQQQLNIPYQQFEQQQAYPFQTTGWLANIAEGLGGASGGQSSTTQPGASIGSQIAGAGLTGAGIYNLMGGAGGLASLFGGGASAGAGGAELASNFFGAGALGDAVTPALFALANGGSVPSRHRGGLIPHRDDGGSIPGIIPGMNVQLRFMPSGQSQGHRNTIPSPPHPQQQENPLAGIGELKGLFTPAGGKTTTMSQGNPDAQTISDLGIYAPLPDETSPLQAKRGGLIPANTNRWQEPQKNIAYGGGGGVVMPTLPTSGGGSFTAPNGVQIPQLATGAAPQLSIAPNLTQNYSPPTGPLPHTTYMSPTSAAPPVSTGLTPSVGPGANTKYVPGIGMVTDKNGYFYANGAGDALGGAGMQAASNAFSNFAKGGLIGRYADGSDVEDDDANTTSIPDAGLVATPQSNAGIIPVAPKAMDTAALKEALANPHVDPWSSVLTAGLGMLAGTSPQAAVNIGRGALLGLQSYGEQKQGAREAAQQSFNADTKAQQMVNEAERWRSQQAMTKEQMAETAANARLPYTAGMTPYQKAEISAQEEANNREKYSFLPGTQADSNDPTKTVQGIYRMSNLNPNPEFVPGVNLTQKGPPPLSGTDATTAKMIANYRLAPPSARTLTSPQGQALMQQVAAINPEYDAAQYGARNQAITRFDSGKQGDTIRSVNNTVQHTYLLRQAAQALDNGDIEGLNQLDNTFKTAFGQPAPRTYNAIAQIAGDEVGKSVLGGSGALGDRESINRNLADKLSPGEIAGVLDGYIGLMGGQINGLRRQYESSTHLKDFDEKLNPETIAAYKNIPPIVLDLPVSNGKVDANKLVPGAMYHTKNGSASWNPDTNKFTPMGQ